MPSFFRLVTVAAVLLAASTIGRSQGVAARGVPAVQMPAAATPYPGAGVPMLQPERMAVVDPDKKLSAGDQVTFEIVEDREGGFPRVVTASGELDVPPLGRVKVAGKTVNEVAAEIKVLLERDFYYHATVHLAIDRVSPVQVRAGLVYLSGEVRMVGPQEIITGEALTLANAILKAGGLGPWGNGQKVRLMRQRNGATQTSVINFDDIIRTGDVKKDPVLQDGDRIFVPKKLYQF